MKNNRTITALFATLLIGFASCQEPIIIDTPDPVQDGYVRVSFKAEVPDMAEVQTKVVDPDGEDISNMTLFCFNDRGLFLSTVSADLEQASGTPSLSGTFEAVIPENTDKIHFVANQNMNLFPESEFISKTETEVLSAMEGSSGMMIYWARYEKTGESDIATELNTMGKIQLVRNHAKITVSDTGKHGAAITGFSAVNTNAFGTVAPYNSGASSSADAWLAPSYSSGRVYVTIPLDKSKLSDITDVRTISSEPNQYVFESPNTSADPVSIILRDAAGKYYKVLLMDENGEFIPIMRNHSYVINVAGPLSYGQDTFDAALTAPATNNVWLSISDEIKSVIGNGYQLSVEKTHIVVSTMPSGNKLELKYSLKNADGSNLTSGERPTVSWISGNTVAQQAFTDNYSAEGDGTVTVTLITLSDGETKKEGTLLIKHGKLQRTIKITTIPVQKFEPAWITTNVYGTGTGEKVTLMFDIPDTYPAEMFPMEVLVSVNDLDVRNESGMILPVIRDDDPRYGNDINGTDGKPIGYKYVLTVAQPGTQRIYFHTILSHPASAHIDATIEAEHFTTLTKRATFQNEANKHILIHNLRSYVAAQPADDVIYFYLVPPKKGARVEFPSHLAENITWNEDHTVMNYNPVAPKSNDEFLFYSNYLDHNDAKTDTKYFTFYEINKANWSTGGRVHGFVPNGNLTDDYGATYHMITNTSDANEVVRIASNPEGQPSVTGNGTSKSDPYRSAVFELATFNPFHFAAEFNSVGTVKTDRNEEVVDNVQVQYGIGRKAVIKFDVTSYMSHIQTVTSDSEQVSVDPFGRSFEIYIDAPMLELDTQSPAYSKIADKIKKHPTISGRFVYTVDASRETERTYGAESAAVADGSTHTYLDRVSSGITINQIGERKVIPFKTKDIVSAGDIVISSQESEVMYYTKTFKLTNQSITGSIKFGADASVATAVPARSFVPMERTYDGTRIGSMTITADGKYELRLRAEYDFDWNTDEIIFEFHKDEGGQIVHYSAKVKSLDYLFDNPNLVLVKTHVH